LADSSNKN